MKKSKNIYLVGFMASGKSSFGKKLARHLELPFIDLDKEIEDSEKRSINEIFSEKGEEYFRDLESFWIQKEHAKSSVIALGGGTPCYNDNINVLKEKGLLIYLQTPLEILIGRLIRSKEKRPIVKDLDNEEVKKVVSKLFKKREKYYLETHLKIDSSKSDFDKKKEIERYITENQKWNSLLES